MPLILIDIVGPIPASQAASPAAALAEALGRAMGTPPGATWVRLRRTDAADYAEQGISTDELVREGWPVFVDVLLAQPGTQEELSAMMRQIAQAVATVLQRSPARIHVIFAPAGAGRVAFGGQWVSGT